MSHLKLFSPVEIEESLDTDDHLIPFSRQHRFANGAHGSVEPVDRARILHENATCPECERSDVEPLELADSVVSPKNRQPIPGTATIVGFHCNCCNYEWPVYQLKRRNGS